MLWPVATDPSHAAPLNRRSLAELTVRDVHGDLLEVQAGDPARVRAAAPGERVPLADVVDIPASLRDLLDAGAEQHLLVRLVASPTVWRERIITREPAGWSGLKHLLSLSDGDLDGLAGGLVLDTERSAIRELADRIRAALAQ